MLFNSSNGITITSNNTAMNPEEKARRLISKFMPIAGIEDSTIDPNWIARECALICVEEMLIQKYPFISFDEYKKHFDYWQQVKSHLNKPQ